MRLFVKEFIEDNIDLIENRKWQDLCYKWIEASQEEIFYDDSYLFEFDRILNEAEIPFMELTEQIRESILENEIEKCVKSILNSKYVNIATIVSKKGIYDKIPFSLGFTVSEFYHIMDKVVENKFSGKLELDSNQTYKIIR